jgi:hypothetical protein
MRARWALVVVGLMLIALLVRLALERGRTPEFVEPSGFASELATTPVATSDAPPERMAHAEASAPVAPPLDEHVTTLRVEDELGAAIAGGGTLARRRSRRGSGSARATNSERSRCRPTC